MVGRTGFKPILPAPCMQAKYRCTSL